MCVFAPGHFVNPMLCTDSFHLLKHYLSGYQSFSASASALHLTGHLTGLFCSPIILVEILTGYIGVYEAHKLSDA